jgi:hypothetical protein
MKLVTQSSGFFLFEFFSQKVIVINILISPFAKNAFPRLLLACSPFWLLLLQTIISTPTGFPGSFVS